MSAGALRHRVTIRSSAVTTPDEYGGGTRTTSDVATVWAAIEPARGQERHVAAALREQITHVVTIRYRSDVTPQMRVVWQGRTFVIRAVIEPEMVQTWLTLYCEEGE